MADEIVEGGGMNHFKSEYRRTVELYVITPLTKQAWATLTDDDSIIIDAPNDERSHGCINRIVDNLNKLAGLRQ